MRLWIVLIVLIFSADLAAKNTENRRDVKLMRRIQIETGEYQMSVFEINKIRMGPSVTATLVSVPSDWFPTKAEKKRLLSLCDEAKREIAQMKKLIIKGNNSLRKWTHSERRLRSMRTELSKDYFRLRRRNGGMLRAVKKDWKVLVPMLLLEFKNVKSGCRRLKAEIRKLK